MPTLWEAQIGDKIRNIHTKNVYEIVKVEHVSGLSGDYRVIEVMACYQGEGEGTIRFNEDYYRHWVIHDGGEEE